ncbi:MAG TPA: hypothetical protein VM406_00190 [Noviherbaspirillum sp.]|nr:hypothetical protein [Noviherbaspirillum sp.]
MSSFRPDAGIPVLTEIIDTPEQLDEPAPATPLASPAAVPAASDPLDLERWEQLERELHERILQQVLKHIDFALEQRVRDSLADVLQTAVEQLAGDIRSGLQQTVKDVVTRAVMHEINVARTSKK